MADLLAHVATLSLLRAAWLDVLAKDRDDGAPGAGVSRFAEDAEENLNEARREGGRRDIPAWSPEAGARQLHGLEDAAASGADGLRYADDFAIAAASQDEAWEAMRVASDAVAELGMRLGADKSAVMSFHDGFCFLGEDFGPRYPPALDDYRAIEPPRRVLYVGVQGAHVRVAAGRVIVESVQDEELLDVPSGQLERLVLFGAVGLSAGARSWALANAVDLVFLSRRGSYLGHGWAAASKSRVTRLRAQLAASADPARVAVFARSVAEAQIRKQIVLLQRFGRRNTAEAVAEAAGQMRQLLNAFAGCGHQR
jgi:CRISPR-associated protein Cas1